MLTEAPAFARTASPLKQRLSSAAALFVKLTSAIILRGKLVGVRPDDVSLPVWCGPGTPTRFRYKRSLVRPPLTSVESEAFVYQFLSILPGAGSGDTTRALPAQPIRARPKQYVIASRIF